LIVGKKEFEEQKRLASLEREWEFMPRRGLAKFTTSNFALHITLTTEHEVDPCEASDTRVFSINRWVFIKICG
jgi:hypothetical protein